MSVFLKREAFKFFVATSLGHASPYSNFYFFKKDAFIFLRIRVKCQPLPKNKKARMISQILQSRESGWVHSHQIVQRNHGFMSGHLIREAIFVATLLPTN